MFKNYITLTLAFVLTGCSSASGPAYTSFQSGNVSNTGIYIYRPDALFGATASPPVSVDGKSLGSLKNNGFLFARVAPGSHTISISYRDLFIAKYRTFNVHVAQNQVAYVKVLWANGGEQRMHNAGSGKNPLYYSAPEYNWVYHQVSAGTAKSELHSLNFSQ